MHAVFPRRHGEPLERVLNVLSALTLIMTIPQVLAIWSRRSAGSVSLLSWAAYLVAACFWFIHGFQRRDKSIYIPCIAWILLDAAVVIGILLYR